MYTSSSRRRTLALFMLVMWCYVVLAPTLASAASVTIPNGTPIDLMFQSTVSAETAVVGQTIPLSVVNEVKVGGIVVIAQGALAQGEVVAAQQRGSVGKAASINVILRSVQAVDGTSVSLTGQKQVLGEDKQTESLVITLLCCILALLQKGGAAEIPAGSTVRGTVMGPIVVEA